MTSEFNFFLDVTKRIRDICCVIILFLLSCCSFVHVVPLQLVGLT